MKLAGRPLGKGASVAGVEVGGGMHFGYWQR